MSLIIGYTYTKASIINWKLAIRKVGMNNLCWIDQRYPSNQEIRDIKDSLKREEVCIIFNANDIPVECYQPSKIFSQSMEI